MNQINLEGLLRSQFGYVGRAFDLDNIASKKEVARRTLLGTEMVAPLDIAMPGIALASTEGVEVEKIDGQSFWKMSLESIVSIRGANKIIRNYPNQSDSGGSVKERWSDDDYVISIKGILMNLKGMTYPEAQVRQLKEFMRFKNSILVKNKLINLFDVERLAIESFEFPHTDGENVQAFTIKAYSDNLFDSLLEEI